MGFVSERLRDIRVLNGYTVEYVADYLGVTKQAVSKYENGITVPSIDVLERIVKLFALPAGYLTKETALPRKMSPVFYRKPKSRTSQKEMDRIKIYFKCCYELITESRKYGGYNLLDLPQFSEDQTVEQKADALRAHWKLGQQPIGDMVSVLEKHGFYVFSVDLQGCKIDGAFQCVEDIPMILINVARGSRERQNFSMAHELGHLILHSCMEQADGDEIEQQANLFASCFLMPEKMIRRDIIRIDADSLILLGEKWNVSPQAVLERCADLELLEKNAEARTAQTAYLYQRLYKKKKYYQSEERKICTLRGLLEKINSEETLREKFLGNLCFPVREIQKLCGMPELFCGYEMETGIEEVQNMDGAQLSFLF